MDLLAGLGRTLGFSFAAGINLYATVALLGLASRFGWVALPPQYKAFDSDLIIYTALALYVIEFLADKIPWVDSIWDAVHTFIRPVGGAVIAVTALGQASPTMMALAALLGGLVAGTTHVTKAGTRVLANTSPEPFSNWFLSLAEDLFVVGLAGLALKYPVAALGVTASLLLLIFVFAATIIRAFRRRFGRRPPAAGAAAVLALIAVGLSGQDPAIAQQAPPGQQIPAARQAAPREQAPPPPAPNQSDRPLQPPVFRAGANAVRVDVFATKDDVPVVDLTAADFDVFEDNTPQKIDAFEHVKVQAGGPPAARVEPRTVRESNEMVRDPRARVFVLFLDTYHVHMAGAYNVRRPLANLLNRVIGDEDLIAVMTPDMSARDITFTRRTDKIADMLERTSFQWGQRDALNKRDPVEQRYEFCYPVTMGSMRSTSAIAQEMIDRRREKNTLDALEDLVRHLDGLREERKAILLVSEGWLLYRENRALAEGLVSTPGVYIGPDGRITNSNPNSSTGNRTECDMDRVMLAQMDDERRFRDIMNEANRANASIYPVEPRGLPVFDNDIGPNPPPPPSVDMAMLHARGEALRTAALMTDGVAVINSNNIDAGLKRVVSDLSSYYLLGYTSTNSKLDGKFRSIRVRVKRPGIEVRARRGYMAPTEEEAAMRAAGAAPPVADEAAAAVTKSIATLDVIRADAPLRTSVSAGWWSPGGEPVKGKPAGAEPALWILGEVNTRQGTGEDWSQGGEADVAIATDGGTAIARYTVPIPAGAGRFLSRFPRTVEDVWLDPGTYAVRIRVKPAAGGLPTTDTARFDVPAPAGTEKLMLGQPLYFRRGPAAASPDSPTADRRFRRTERLVVQISASLALDSVAADLVDRRGQPIALPVSATTMEKDLVRWVRAEVTLASLAAGDYLVRVTTQKGTEKVLMLAPFRIVP